VIDTIRFDEKGVQMTETYRLEEAFQKFIATLLSNEKYRVEGFQATAGRAPTNLIVRTPSGQRAVVEIKLFRTRIVPRSSVINAIAQLEAMKRLVVADSGLLIISSFLAIPISELGKNEIWDMKKLGERVARYPEMVAQFEELSRELSSPLPPSDFDLSAYVTLGEASLEPYVPITEPTEEGARLASELQAIASGKKGARAFETAGLKALQYIFRDDLSNWSPQKVTDGGISRYDVIARISSAHDFWQSILKFFHSWYVVFEFKNHAELIKQGQIYTTEKYLFAGARRLTAFIVSRNGADKNALAATRGAVRESGKLIVNLSLEDIYKMLQMKDNGDDPNSLLFDTLDEMLMKLER
jgi:hypothetical protein